jgi:streptogramin lyase
MQSPSSSLDRFSVPRRLLRLGLLGTLAVASTGAMAAPDYIVLPGDRAFPESITSTRDGTLYTGSFASGGIVRVRPNERPELWIQPGASNTASTFGVVADERSNTLWVCSNNLSALGINIPGSTPGSTLKGFDLNTGEVKVSATLAGDKTLCNDIAIGADGSAYVTNSLTPEILKLAPGAHTFSVWFTDPTLQPPTGAGLDGLAFGGDGNLYVDRYGPADLYRIDIKSGKASKLTKLQTSRPLVLADALRPLGRHAFLLIEGGGRLDRMTVEGDAARIETLKEGYSTPTGVTPVGDTAWVSEGQLSYLLDPAKRGQQPSLPFKLFAVPIPK